MKLKLDCNGLIDVGRVQDPEASSKNCIQEAEQTKKVVCWRVKLEGQSRGS